MGSGRHCFLPELCLRRKKKKMLGGIQSGGSYLPSQRPAGPAGGGWGGGGRVGGHKCRFLTPSPLMGGLLRAEQTCFEQLPASKLKAAPLAGLQNNILSGKSSAASPGMATVGSLWSAASGLALGGSRQPARPESSPRPRPAEAPVSPVTPRTSCLSF